MKIFDIFNEEEKEIINKKTEITIENKDYDYDEITNIRVNFEKFYDEKENKEVNRKIVNKLKKIERQFEEKFNYKKWRYKELYYVEDVEKEFEKIDIIGKRLIDIKATDNETYLSKESMINCYNNNETLMENDNWDLMKKITINYIPGFIERGKVASFDTPLIFILDDHSTFELVVKDYSKLRISKNLLTNNFEYNINPSELYKEVIGKRIKKVEVIKVDKEGVWNNYIDEKIKSDNNFDCIKIIFEDNYEIRIVNGMFVLFKDDQVCVTTIEEWKKCVKHYEWLFSKEAKSRFADKKNDNWPELTRAEEALIEILKMKKIPKGAILGMMSFVHAGKKDKEMLEYFLECNDKGAFEKITKDDIFNKIVELILNKE